MINAQRLSELVSDSLFENEAEVKGAEIRKVEGITATFGFHPQRLEKHREEVIGFLKQLPDSFMKTKGGGMSFLQAAVDRDGHLWGQHIDMQNLFMLGQGLGLVVLSMPRAFWDILPGGMPYYTVDDTKFEEGTK
jgi:hypothetical protein